MLLWQDPAADQEAADFQEVALAAEDAAQAAASQAAEAASEVAHSAEARDPQAEVLAAAEAAALAVEDTTDRIDLTATITIITTITADFGFLDRDATTDTAAVVVLADF